MPLRPKTTNTGRRLSANKLLASTVYAGLLCFASTSPEAQAGNLTGTFESAYYNDFPLFHFYPDEEGARYEMDRIGPIGIGLELLQPAFTMRITRVDEGSPAAATGQLEKGQYIESINGQQLKDRDPRVILGNLITEAEAKDGLLKMMIKDTPAAAAEEVIVKLPVLGAYSETWPLHCGKSETIVRRFADFLAAHPRGWGSALFLLSTGEEKDLDVVRGWFSGKLPEDMGGIPWSIGYTGPAICEYYLRTGDETVLPAIKSMADYLKRTQYNGAWAGRGGAPFRYMAGGHMNAAGVHCVTFLMLAKECGVEIDEYLLQSALRHFYRYAGHLNVSYGDGLPEGGGVDNGKNGGLAFAMAAAASLSPQGEKSVYAKARDISANKSFYTTSWLYHGHTGGGIGELWRGAAMGLLQEKRSAPYRSFMNERRWMYELARGHDGSFGWCSGMNVGYSTTGHQGGKAWGNYVPLVYTVPRKQLRIFGAPPSKFSNPYPLPERPWGTAADEAFYSLQGGEYRPGQQQDMSSERLPTHASWPNIRRFSKPDVTDEELLMFAHHPDSTARSSAAGQIAKLGRSDLALELLKSKDPRGRLSGIRALGGRLDDESIALLGGMITDPEESWWVVIDALAALGQAPPAKMAAYIDRLAYWLEHDDWWLRQAALKAVTPIATDPQFCRQVLPIVGKMIVSNQRAAALGPVRGIVDALQQADPEVQAFAVEVFGTSYAGFPGKLKAPGGQDLSDGADVLLESLASNLARAPGGFDALYEVSRERFPDSPLPHQKLYMNADADQFGPQVQQALEPLVRDYLIPKYIGAYNHIATNAQLLLDEAASKEMKANFYYREPRMKALVDLYNRIGVHDYDWQDHGPDLTEIDWIYHTFDPPEKKLWEPGTRYRDVTLPRGMENWFAVDFDAASKGWQRGRAPFGQLGGKLVTQPGSCDLNFCRHGEPMNTFWDKEVLLMRTQIKLPALEEGHRYRLVIGGMSHVNYGDGYRIYLNGKQVAERKQGVGKREGGRPNCFYITRDWWPAFHEEVTVAVTSFMPIPGGKRSPGVKKNHFSAWFQQMKIPPLTRKAILKGKSLQPLLNSEWQTSLEDDDRYQYDGTVTANDGLLGTWVQVDQVAHIEDFNPNQPAAGKKDAPFEALHIKPDGKTDDELLMWTGNTLMDLHRYQALKMEVKPIGDRAYLFVESGGFNKKHPDDWKSSWTVMVRSQ